ncbi:MAG: M23 family metallopeptidase [Candidatus Paceibacterota bacterium]
MPDKVMLNIPEKLVILPIPIKITSPFGDRVLKDKELRGGKKHFHNGVDLSAPVGTPCLCPLPGKVVKRYWSDLGGWQLIIKHENNLFTGWAHLSKYADGVVVGSELKTGQVCCYTGNSGVSGKKDEKTGELLKNGYVPHLHFTLRVGKVFIDPEIYIAQGVNLIAG